MLRSKFQFNTHFSSTIFQKYIMAVTGLGLVLFVIVHLLGNLTLLAPDPSLFNNYAHQLMSFGTWLQMAEVGLLALAGAHIALAIKLKLAAMKARPIGYSETRSKKGPSKMGIASKNLIITGLVILFFLVIHIWQFKFGPSIEEGFVTRINGRPARDLHRLVKESFQNKSTVSFYILSLIFLGLHLRHGIWSSFQSLGALRQRTSRPLYVVGGFLTSVIIAGFISIPIFLYFDLPNKIASKSVMDASPKGEKK